MKGDKSFINCRCGVKISPMFIFYFPELKGCCPMCKRNLISATSLINAAKMMKDTTSSRRPDKYHPTSPECAKEEKKIYKDCWIPIALYHAAALKIIESIRGAG